MKTYKTLTEAYIEALPVCKKWVLVETGDVFNAKGMGELCLVWDADNPMLEEELHYVVFPDGELGIINAKSMLVYQLFVPFKEQPVETASKPRNFCPYCGTKIVEGARFCEMCGNKID